MGNEASQASGNTTPLSEDMSMYSWASTRRRSSASTAQHSPLEAPEPDLSHLSEEERAQIAAVIARAKALQEEESVRVRELENDYTSYAESVVRRTSTVQEEPEQKTRCPICLSTELKELTGGREGQNVCVDCERFVCSNCGEFSTSLSTKLQEWICTMCKKRRRYILSTGMWYHGHHTGIQLPTFRGIGPEDFERWRKRTALQDKGKRHSLERTSSLSEYEDYKEFKEGEERREQQKKPMQRQGSLPSSFDEPQNEAIQRNLQAIEESDYTATSSRDSIDEEFERTREDSSNFMKVSSLVSSTADKVHRMSEQATAMQPLQRVGKSDSDDTADVPKKVHRTRQPDGASPRDESCDLLSNKVPSSPSSDDSYSKKGHHRPKSLSLSRQHSATSSEEELEEIADNEKQAIAPSQQTHQNNITSNVVPKKRTRGDGNENVETTPKRQGADTTVRTRSSTKVLDDSPSPPRSPVQIQKYRDTETSPSRREEQSVMCDVSPTKSPKETDYMEFQTISRTTSGKDFYLDSLDSGRHERDYSQGLGSPEKRYPPELPTRPQARIIELTEVTSEDEDAPPSIMSEHAMDLASYAAAIAVDTDNLTNLSVSPVNLPPANVRHLQDHEYLEISPGSEDSCSISPPSPNYYDESDEMELPDPADKSIDYQGTKRQKARPPSNDWSPITDLSPILDVSPSIEAAEQEEMLVQQERARAERTDGDQKQTSAVTCDTQNEDVFQSPEDISPQPAPLKRYDRFDDISKLSDRDRTGTDRQDDVDIGDVQLTDDDLKTFASLQKSGDYARGRRDKGSGERVKPELSRDLEDSVDSKSYASQPHRYFIREPDELIIDKEFPKLRDNDSDDQNSLLKQRRRLPQPTSEMLAEEATRKSPTRVGATPEVRPANYFDSASNKAMPLSTTSVTFDTTRISFVEKQEISNFSDSTTKSKTQSLTIKRTGVHESIKPSDYSVLKSPVTPECGEIAEVSVLTSNAEELSLGNEKFIYSTSPVSPAPDSSPPKPQSPTVPKTDYTPITLSISESRTTTPSTASTVSSTPESTSSSKSHAEIKKIRRKLPPIPPGVEAVQPPSRMGRPKSANEVLKAERQGKEDPKTKKRLPPAPRESAAGKKITPRPTTDPVRKTVEINGGKNDRKQITTTTPVIKKVPPPVPKKPVIDRSGANKTNGKVSVSYISTPSSAAKSSTVDSTVSSRFNSTTNITTTTSVNVAKKQAITPHNLRDKHILSTVAKSKPVTRPIPEKAVAPPSPEYVNIHGLKVPLAIKSIKQRLKEEIQIVTASRRLEIDEMEEIRIMERQLEQLRAQERKQKENMTKEVKEKFSTETKSKPLISRPVQDTRRKVTPPVATITSRMSPQASPRRARHKRQNSDPMVAKFSPIEEAKDIESDLLAQEERKNNVRGRDPSPHKPISMIGSATPPASSHLTPCVSLPKLSKSSELLSTSAATDRENPLTSSQSETLLSRGSPRSGAGTPTFYSDDDEKKTRENKTSKLRLEIQKRKEQIEENARLQQEIRKMVDATDVSRRSLDDIRQQIRLTDIVRPSDKIPTGIIRPIDYEEASNMEYNILPDIPLTLSKSLPQTPTDYYENGNYSSSEYLAHKNERSPQRDFSRYVSDFENRGNFLDEPGYYDGRILPPPGAHFVKSGDLCLPAFADSRDSGLPSSMTLQDGHILRSELDVMTQFDAHSEFTATSTDAETTPISENMVSVVTTPAMPLLDDVTTKSRKIIREMGGRPLSDDMDKYLAPEEPLHPMYRTESEQSFGSDEPIMEHMTAGGVTILNQIERKKQPPPPEQRNYTFPTKRILLTRDPKDRSVKGNGIGMKIVGGKSIPGSDVEMGAFVAVIYPGGVADQLHGELQEGDQILEWNGIELSGKTYEEVQKTISHPNGEIELVVRPCDTQLGSKPSTMSTIRSDSCHSSYDNLDFTSDYDEYDSYAESSGVDPSVLAAQLEGIRERMSPGVSPTSSQPDVCMTPTMSTPCSSPQSLSPPPSSSDKSHLRTGQNQMQEDRDMGEIQLQLSFDDYDSTLNVHVLQARRLLPKDKGGSSDPFVKVYLLPGRSADNKRRTKYIPKTLDPEWNQTLVFMGTPRDDLRSRTLEITVWDYDRFKPNDFLGEVLIDLSDDEFLDNKPHWYELHEHDENNTAKLPKPRILSPRSHSPARSTHSSRSAAKPAANGKHGSRNRASSAGPGLDRRPSPHRHRDNEYLSAGTDKSQVKLSPGTGRRKSAGHVEIDPESMASFHDYESITEIGSYQDPFMELDEMLTNLTLFTRKCCHMQTEKASSDDDTIITGTSESNSAAEADFCLPNRYVRELESSRVSSLDLQQTATPQLIFAKPNLMLGPGQVLDPSRCSSIISLSATEYGTHPSTFSSLVSGEILLGIQKSTDGNVYRISVLQCRRIRDIFLPSGGAQGYLDRESRSLVRQSTNRTRQHTPEQGGFSRGF